MNAYVDKVLQSRPSLDGKKGEKCACTISQDMCMLKASHMDTDEGKKERKKMCATIAQRTGVWRHNADTNISNQYYVLCFPIFTAVLRGRWSSSGQRRIVLRWTSHGPI